MFGYLTFLHAEHIEPKRLVTLTVLAGPRLAHVDDDHVVLADHIQQLAGVVGWGFWAKRARNASMKPFSPVGT